MAVKRLKITIQGAVQGVGFRPFVYRLADELQLTGWVINSGSGVFIEVEGSPDNLALFLRRVHDERPPQSSIHTLEQAQLDPAGYQQFEIRKSDEGGETTAIMLPDLATCPDCRKELFDPADRRYRYPFINCTNCGPRFTIISALPYDRPNTSMKHFQMCPACEEEYRNPADRRFHAQPNACPECGPHIELWDHSGQVMASHEAALHQAVAAIEAGKIVAVKGLGGFHLICDAGNSPAIRRLRERKHREEKPFALMFPDLSLIRQYCHVSETEARLLQSSQAPIVLLKQCLPHPPGLSEEVAPGNPYLGVMLPYTPLHHLLLSDLDKPVVATSGNISDEPICIDEQEALQRLHGIADLFLVHNRPILRHADDSIVRLIAGREMVMRRARGYAPLPIRLPSAPPPTLAVGAHLKNSIALSVGKNVFISQHIGDLETEASFNAFQEVIDRFKEVYRTEPEIIAADLHPDYLSSQYAREQNRPIHTVQHHYAHILSCMLENEIEPPVLGISWDGTGLGDDGTVWGGEFLEITQNDFIRRACFRPFRLPGGDHAIREPRRSALGALFEICRSEEEKHYPSELWQSFSEPERKTLFRMLSRGINAPLSSSAGRLFDAVAALTGLRYRNNFEGQAAMELEFLLPDAPREAGSYPLRVRREKNSGKKSLLILDWAVMMEAIRNDKQQGVAAAVISAKFHNTLVESCLDVAKAVGLEKVALSGGCFQNKYLTEGVIRRLQAEGFRVYWHQQAPPNDGGIALGQIGAVWRLHQNK